MWDARTGTPLLDLRGHTGPVLSAAFSPDGARIVTGSSDETAKVWDASTGQELVGAPIPPATRLDQISPDGRWIAHILANRVELILLHPDEEELSARRLLMQPDFRLYREAYDAAMEANDAFAARFYLNLFPPPERALIRAEAIVKPLFARLLLRDDVLAALQAQPAADPETQAACLKLAGTWPESASACNEAGWAAVREPGLPDADYHRGLRLARAACRLEPENAAFLNTLGVAQYRCGLMAEALATLTRTNALNQEKDPANLAFLALAQHHLGLSDQAPRHAGPAARGDEGRTAGRDSRITGFTPRGRDDRARPGLPGRPVRAVIADEAASRNEVSKMRRTGAGVPWPVCRRLVP